jgi:probable F420-dependent oxidoreductase
MTKLGILSATPSFEELVWLAGRAEAAGFDSVWAGEYFSRNVITSLTAMTMATKRVAIGSSIAYAFARSPVQLAAAAADIDELCAGRLLLGLGTGTRAQNEQWYGVPFANPGPKLREVIEVARAAWSAKQGGLRYRGRFYELSIPNFVRHHQARDRIPIYLGAVSPYMLRLAGRVADGVLGHPTYTRSYYCETVLAAMRQGAAQAGRNPNGIECVLEVVTVVDRDGGRARRDASRWLTFYYVGKPFHPILDFHGWAQEKAAIVGAFRSMDAERMGRTVSDRMWKEVLALVGTPDEVRDQWREISTMADHVVLLAPAPYGGLGFERYRENCELIFELFGRAGREKEISS